MKEKEKCNESLLYIVSANTYKEDTYGIEIRLLGIADNEEDLQKIINKAHEKYGCGLLVHVDKVLLNTSTNLYLGSYYE